MSAIEKVVPVLPVALMSEIILDNQNRWCSELELKTKAAKKIRQLREQGAPIDISESACERVLSSALDMLFGRGFVEMEDNLYRAEAESISLLAYYANSIEHWR